MNQRAGDYEVGYGKPPLETRFQKGRSGNPEGTRRPRETKSLPALLAEALSRRTGWPKEDGSWMTQAEAIFAALVAEACGPDLKAKRVLFDLLAKLHRAANTGWERLPEIQLDDSTDARAQVDADLARGTEAMRRDLAAQRAAAAEPEPADPDAAM
jgi:hypothetical protein